MNYFEEAANFLIESGFINFLIPSILSFAFFYILFEKLKLITNKTLNALISFSISLLIFIYPLISGMNIALALSYFFAQSFSFILVIVIGLLLASLFYPDLPQKLSIFFRTRGILVGMISLGVVFFLLSGLISVLFPAFFTSSQYQRTQITVTDELTKFGVLIGLLAVFGVIIIAAGRMR
jgi:uncharacterized membrane protein YjfL (UPF0719 family)